MAEIPLVLGFDLGGTKMLAAVVGGDFSVRGRAKQKTGTERGNDAVFAGIVDTIEQAITNAGCGLSDIAGVGIACPGPIDMRAGVVLETPNLDLRDFALRDRLTKKLGVPVVLENDVNAGVYGEYVAGAGRGFRHIVGLFPGTGIGGGLILDGKLYRGARGGAGEIGHMVVQVDGRRCGCGRFGCLEAVASRSALAKDLVALAANGEAPIIREKAGTDFLAIKSGTIAKAMEAGEAAVTELVMRSARFLGIGMGNCVNVFDPELIILGGGMVERFGTQYLAVATESMRETGMKRMVEHVKVKAAELGDDAAVIGAAALLRESFARESSR
ncbi:MAG: ROK family protein [Spirochaetaceae bacterium]|nr:MAG: ROK family protein [Spirochaetaceae bacterium]